MNITLNGKPHTLNQPRSISQLLSDLDIAPRRLAIELNAEILPRSQFDTTQVQEGDAIEIVQAIGGG